MPAGEEGWKELSFFLCACDRDSQYLFLFFPAGVEPRVRMCSHTRMYCPRPTRIGSLRYNVGEMFWLRSYLEYKVGDLFQNGDNDDDVHLPQRKI